MPFRSLRWLEAHRQLPVVLRVWAVVPATVVLVIAGGLAFTLPTGALCDEGMVLFMEGGCDWGLSNEFFFSKLGLLVAMNLLFIVAWVHRVREWRGFLPHYLVLAILTIANYSDEACRHYYSHPNGSIGQMTAEAIAFGAVGAAILTRIPLRKPLQLTLATLGWNALHVAAFYLALLVANHWTWLHTLLIISLLLGAVAVIASINRAPRSRGVRHSVSRQVQGE